MPGGVADLLALQIIISCRNEAAAVLASLGLSAGGALAPVAKAALGVGAAVAAIGIASIHAATGFDQSMQKIAALTTTSQQQMEWYKSKLLEMAPALDQTPDALAKGLYFVISAGYSSQQALDILSYSAKSAATNMTDMASVSDLLTTSMNAYRVQGLSAGHAIDDLTKLVVNGKIQMSNLAASFGFVAVTAANAGLSFDETSAAVSALSQISGAHGARRVMMDLDFALRNLGPKMEDISAKAEKMKDLKQPWDAAAFAAMNFGQKVAYIASETGGIGYLDKTQAAAYMATGNFQNLAQATAHANKQFMTLVGGAAAFLPMAMLLGDKMKSYNTILAQMGGNGSATDAAFVKMRESTAQMQRMAEIMFQTILTRIGLQLLPALNNFLGGLYKVGEAMYSWVSSAKGWEQIKSFLVGLATVIAVLLGPAIVSAAAGLVTFLAPVAAVVAAALILGPIVQALVAHFGGWDAVARRVGGALAALGAVAGRVTAFFRAHELALDALRAVLAAVIIYIVATAVPAFLAWAASATAAAVATIAATWPLLAIIGAIALVVLGVIELVKHWGAVTTALGDFAAAVGDFLGGAGAAIGAFFSGLGSMVRGGLDDAGSAIGGFFSGLGSRVHDGLAAARDGAGNFVGSVVSGWQYLYAHSYTIQAIVDAVAGYFLRLWGDVVTVGGWIGGAWDWIWAHASASLRALWAGIVAYWQSQVAVARQWVTALGSAVSSAWDGLWTGVSSRLRAIWSGVVAYWNGQLAVARQWVSAIGANILGPLGSLAGQLLGAGWNLIQSLAQGIWNGIQGVLKGAVNGAAQVVKDVLGWHSPTREGPGADSHTWAPNLVRMFAAGLTAGVPVVGSAASSLAAQVAGALGGVGGAATGGSAAFAGLAGASAATVGGGGVTQYHNWAGAFPNATSAGEIRAAIEDVQRDQYRRARRAGFGGGLRAGIGGGR